MEDGLCDADALAVAARERVDGAVHDGGDGAERGGFVDAVAALCGGDAALLSDRGEGIGDYHIVVEWVIFGEVAQVLAHQLGVLGDVVACDADDAGARAQ